MSAKRKQGAKAAPSAQPVQVSELEAESTPQPAPAGASTGFDRLGGLDGLFSIMGRIQQLFGFFMQMRPAFKLIGSFMGPKATVSGTPRKNASSGQAAAVRKPAKGARSASVRTHTAKKKRMPK